MTNFDEIIEMRVTPPLSDATLQLIMERAAREDCTPDEFIQSLLVEEERPATHSVTLHQRVLDASEDSVTLFDLNLRYVYANPAIAERIGTTPEAMIGKTDAELGVPPELLTNWHTLWQIVRQTGEMLIHSFDFETSEGLRHFEASLAPLFNSQGEIEYLFAITRDVSERKQAQETAERTYNVLQRIFNNTQFLLAYMDPDFNFIQVNERYAQIVGKQPHQFIGINHFELYPDEENEALFREVAETGKPVQVHARPFTYPGNPERGVSYWDWNLIPVWDTRANIEGLILTLIDVTERVQAEQKLQENQRLVDVVMRTIPNFVFIYDVKDGRNIYANVGLKKVLGYEIGELAAVGKDSIDQIVHPDDQPELLKALMNIRFEQNHNKVANVVCRLRHKDGSWRWVQIQGVIFSRDEHGEVQQIVGSIIDISETKEAERQLHIKDSALASSITAFALADMEGRLTYVNEAFLKLWKLEDTSQALGRSVLEFWVSPDKAMAIITAILEKNYYVGEMIALLADGSHANIELTASTVRDNHGQPVSLMGSFKNITLERQAEAFALENERLKANFQKEQERMALIQRIISTLSHDLRTPLTVISTSRDLLTKYADRLSDEKRAEKLDQIGRQVRFALELLDDTVNIARGNLSDTSFRPEMVDISHLCRVSVEEVQAASATHHHLRFNNSGNVSNAFVDQILVSRILLNLLSNAIKYSPDGSEIHLELDEDDDWIILRVSDQGRGIAADELDYIFDPFYRSTDVTGIRGTGLGLSIVKDCVERHRGHICVTSNPGKGSTFTVGLPRNRIPSDIDTAD